MPLLPNTETTQQLFSMPAQRQYKDSTETQGTMTSHHFGQKRKNGEFYSRESIASSSLKSVSVTFTDSNHVSENSDLFFETPHFAVKYSSEFIGYCF
jgi:hypothetical protein